MWCVRRLMDYDQRLRGAIGCNLEWTANVADVTRINTAIRVADGDTSSSTVEWTMLELIHVVLIPLQKFQTEVFGNFSVLQ